MPIGNERGIEIFKAAKALLEGHFRLSSGKDALHYVAKDLVWVNYPEGAREICRGIAEDFKHLPIHTVVGPESGAIKYADCVAEILSELTGRKIYSVHAKKCGKDGKEFSFDAKDLAHIKGKNVLIVEDVLTSGGSCRKVVVLSISKGGKVLAVGDVWNRGGITKEDLGVELFTSQISEQYPAFEPGRVTCPGCAKGMLYDLKWGHGNRLIGIDPLAMSCAK